MSRQKYRAYNHRGMILDLDFHWSDPIQHAQKFKLPYQIKGRHSEEEEQNEVLSENHIMRKIEILETSIREGKKGRNHNFTVMTIKFYICIIT